MLISFDLIILFSALLGFSFCLYVLLFSFGEKLESREAGVKYFYLSALSSGILLFGIFLTYYLFQTTNFIFIK
jgi:NADH-quinone oxidoreductase subunit N